LKGTLRIDALAEVKHSMSEEKSYQCDAPRIHCFLDGRFECECGGEWHDEALAEMILGLTTVESHSFEAMGREDLLDQRKIKVDDHARRQLVARGKRAAVMAIGVGAANANV
jgi:hypothetical protein